MCQALVWPVETYGCESWTLRKNEETRLDAFEMKGLRKILRVSWTAKKTNEWVLKKAGVKRELLSYCESKEASILRSHHEETRKLPGERECKEKCRFKQGGRPRTAWMDNIKTWTGLSVKESIRMTDDRDQWRKHVHGVDNPPIEDG